jgi:hypothetical protein
MPSTLELNCLVLGGDINHIFTIKIVDTETIDTLKESIKDRKKLNAIDPTNSPGRDLGNFHNIM